MTMTKAAKHQSNSCDPWLIVDGRPGASRLAQFIGIMGGYYKISTLFLCDQFSLFLI